MTYATLEDLKATGIIGILQTNSHSVPFNLFPAMIIVSVWAIISLGNFYATTRRYGTGDFFASLIVGGFVANIIAGLLLIIPSFMPLRIIVISITLEIIFFMIFLTEKNLKNE